MHFGRTWRVWLAGLLLACVSIGFGAPRGDEPAEAWQPWRDRLTSLRPSDPEAYIKLAEEIFDASLAEDGRHAADLRALAQQLFGLAGALDPGMYGRSACLALANLATDRPERERYLAIASLLPGRDVLATWSRQTSDESVPPSAALVLSEALGFYREGQGNRALSLLQRQSNGEILARFGHLLPGGADRFLEDCKHYMNGRRPTLFESDIARMLVLEAALLAGTERSWSGEVLLTAASPLIEIDPDRLDAMLGVDATKPYFVDGVFVREPMKSSSNN